MPACGIPGAQVVRKSSSVRVDLVDRVLRYEVTETFLNRGSRVGEADYLFPLPKGAALQDLKLSINGEMVSGETMSSDNARQIYEQIVRQQRDPALLEWMGYGLLRARIFPIAPGEEKKVVVRFQTVAPREGDALRVDYFRGLRAGRGGSQQMDGSTSFTLTYPDDPRYGIAYSPTHSISNTDAGNVRRSEIRDAAGEVTILIPVRTSNAPSISLLANAPGTDDGFALITLSPPASARQSVRAIPRDVTFVIDVSGSMAGKKIEQAREAGKQVLRSLSSTDRFHFIDFSTDVRNFRDGWTVASRENIRAAERYLDALEAQGGTNIAAALDDALAEATQPGRLPILLFLTDGQPTVGTTDGDQIAANVAAHRGDRRVFTFGVGSDLNISLIEQLAIEGHGTASFVRPEESVERAIGIVASRLTNPLVTGVRIHADGVQLKSLLPSGPVDVFAGEDLVVLARYSGSGSTTIRFDGRTADGPVTWSSRVLFPDRTRENPFVARLWATQRVGYLSAEKRKHGAASEVDDEIRRLGERYGIPTEFTSYLVLEPGMNPNTFAARSIGSGRIQLQSVVTTGVAAASVAPLSGNATTASLAPGASNTSFESANKAVLLRSARSIAAVDSLAAASSGKRVARAGSLVFVLRDGVWTDTRAASGPTLGVKPFSAAYFQLIGLVPDLREPFTVGDRIKVSGRAMVIEITPAGKEQLTNADIAMIRRLW
ncbi:MAG: VIT and VWA domain-containing protein [Gemmatimonadota bacterium]|nr:VIT and VWA domain-containing protein [Gemmatimonadota bacterium]